MKHSVYFLSAFGLTLISIGVFFVQSIAAPLDEGYKLPWDYGIIRRINQDWDNSGGSHTPCPGINCHAYDFQFSEGESVLASHKGIVSHVSGQNTECGPREYQDKANYVVIAHEDGTSTAYYHLQRVIVSKGDLISKGQLIGFSGKTGWTKLNPTDACAPHLHFSRQKQDTQRVLTTTVPIYFDEYPGVQFSHPEEKESRNFAPRINFFDLPNYNVSGSVFSVFRPGQAGLSFLDNRVSSIELPQDSYWYIEVFDAPNFQGNHQLFYASDPDLSNNYFDGTNIVVDQKISSVVIYNNDLCHLPAHSRLAVLPALIQDQCVPPTATPTTSAGVPTPTRVPDGSTPTATPGPSVPADAWRIDYYNDIELNGPNDGSKCHSEWTSASSYFFKDWGEGSPGGSCNEKFAARIRRHVHLASGHYNFALFADDNARIEVLHAPNGNLVVDQWWATQHYESKDLPEGDYEISIVYRDTGGRAIISAWWGGPNYPAPPRESRDPNQWYAEFWPHQDWFWDPFITFNDGNSLPLNKDWGYGSVGYGLQGDNFSTKYTRTYRFECGDYRFDLNADDYAELEVIDSNTNQSIHHLVVTQVNTTVRSNPPVRLAAKEYEVRVKHKEYGGAAKLYVDWTKVSSCPTPTPAATATNTPIPTNTPVPITPISSTDGELITSWETGVGIWHVGDGGVSVEAVAQYASDGTQAIKLFYSGNPTWSYFQFNFPGTMDLSNYDKLQIHVINPGAPLTMRISVPTGNSWAWHESPTQELPHGSKLLEFDLTANNWTAGSNVGPITNLNQAQGVVVLLDGSAIPNAIFVDNLRKIGQAVSSTPTPVPASELIESWETALGEWPYTNGGAAGIERIQANASDGSFSVMLGFSGPWSHFQYNFPQTVNLAGWDRLQMHVVNTGEPMNIKIVLSTGDMWAWHTSSLQPLPNGEKLLEFSLSGNNWEKEGVWGPLASADQVKAIVVIVEGDNYPGAVYVDSIKVIDAGAQVTSTQVDPETNRTESTEIYLPIVGK